MITHVKDLELFKKIQNLSAFFYGHILDILLNTYNVLCKKLSDLFMYSLSLKFLYLTLFYMGSRIYITTR